LIEAKTYRPQGVTPSTTISVMFPKAKSSTGKSRTIRSIALRNSWIDQKAATKEKLDEITADVMREINEDSDWAESFAECLNPRQRSTEFLINSNRAAGVSAESFGIVNSCGEVGLIETRSLPPPHAGCPRGDPVRTSRY